MRYRHSTIIYTGYILAEKYYVVENLVCCTHLQSIWPNNPGILQSHDGENASFANCHSLICPKKHLLQNRTLKVKHLNSKRISDNILEYTNGLATWILHKTNTSIRAKPVSQCFEKLFPNNRKAKKWVNFLGTNESVVFGKKAAQLESG